MTEWITNFLGLGCYKGMSSCVARDIFTIVFILSSIFIVIFLIKLFLLFRIIKKDYKVTKEFLKEEIKDSKQNDEPN
jgi:hypothetical protein